MACASTSTLTRVMRASGSHATWRASRAGTNARRGSSPSNYEKSNNDMSMFGKPLRKRRSQQLA